MKCAICGDEIKTIFLGKIIGTVVKDAKGRQRQVCFECQKKFPDKSDLLKNMK